MKKIIPIILFSIVIFIIFQFSKKSNSTSLIEESTKVNLEDYSKTLDSIKTLKSNSKDKNTEAIGIEFTNILTTKIFPYWYGTKWDFNGITQKPNEGSIACGYFVTTTLRDIGLKINRVKLAQCASEEMIKSLVSEDNIIRFSNKSIEEFVKKLKNKGNGIYVVGLDNHTGFVLVNSEGSFFIHSSGIAPYKVVKDKLTESLLIVKSKYRIVGKLSSDKKLLSNWVKK
ncbi:hypothetical protein [Flavobacterium sp.]|uniref:hypothetical protein n=1 Tax=Flavobacterium sp. TaxID=239 RepID=UPI0037536C69